MDFQKKHATYNWNAIKSLTDHSNLFTFYPTCQFEIESKQSHYFWNKPRRLITRLLCSSLFSTLGIETKVVATSDG